MTAPQRVALFVTCLVDQILPDIGVATVRLLRQAGYEVVFPEEQTCCGQPFFNSGFRKEARALAQRMIAIFEPYDRVVAPSGSCVTMVRAEFPHLFEDDPDWHERARRLAAKTYELSEFLVHVAGWQPPPQRGDEPERVARITYHDSCHMNRLLHLKAEPRQLLRAAGYQIDEMRESDRCCGFGGLFSVRMPEVSNAMTEEKLRQAAEADAPTIVTCDPGCLMQMRGLASDNVHVEHLAVLLAGDRKKRE
ncbi:MAG: (Fe-S)-binding protein [Caldilineales bacterium]